MMKSLFILPIYADELELRRFEEIQRHYLEMMQEHQGNGVRVKSTVHLYQMAMTKEGPEENIVDKNSTELDKGGYGNESYSTLLIFDDSKRAEVKFSVLDISLGSYQPIHFYFNGSRTFSVETEKSVCTISCRENEVDILPLGNETLLPLIGRSPHSITGATSIISLLDQMNGLDSTISDSQLQIQRQEKTPGGSQTRTLTFSSSGMPQLLSDRLKVIGPSGSRVLTSNFSYLSSDDPLPNAFTTDSIVTISSKSGGTERFLEYRNRVSDIQIEKVENIDDYSFSPDLSSFNEVIDLCGGEAAITDEKSWFKWTLFAVGFFGLSFAWYRSYQNS